MVFYVCNTATRSLGPTGTLHVDAACPTFTPASNKHPWEATPSEILQAHSLCDRCTPPVVGRD